MRQRITAFIITVVMFSFIFAPIAHHDAFAAKGGESGEVNLHLKVSDSDGNFIQATCDIILSDGTFPVQILNNVQTNKSGKISMGVNGAATSGQATCTAGPLTGTGFINGNGAGNTTVLAGFITVQ